MPESKQTRCESTGISFDWETPQHPQKYDYSVTSRVHTIHIKNVSTRFNTSIDKMVNKFDLAQVRNPQKQKVMASQYSSLQVRKAL